MSLEERIKACTACPLARGRTNVVVGRGNPEAKVWIIGEAPGEEEDLSGLPFVGRSGKLISEAIRKAGLNEDTDVYITNVVKCRPPENRRPTENEVVQCLPLLRRQTDLYRSASTTYILCGRTAADTIIPGTNAISIGNLQERIFKTSKPLGITGSTIRIIYHPSYILRNRAMLVAWEDRLKRYLRNE